MYKLNTWWNERIAVPDTDISRESLFEIFSKAFKLDNKKQNIKQQINESMKELLKEDISNLSDEQQTTLIKDVSSILIKIIQLHEYCATELRDSNLTHKVGKAKSYMEDFSNYLTAHRVGESGSMDIDQEEQRLNLNQRNPDEDRGVIEGVEKKDKKQITENIEWKVKCNLKKPWGDLLQEVDSKSFNNKSKVFTTFINETKNYGKLIESKLGKSAQSQFNNLISLLESADDENEFNSATADLYDWADHNRVYVALD